MSSFKSREIKETFDQIFDDYIRFCLRELSTGIYCSYMFNSNYCRFTAVFNKEEFVLVENFYEFLKKNFLIILNQTTGLILNKDIVIN